MEFALGDDRRLRSVMVTALSAWVFVAIWLRRDITGDWGFFVGAARDMFTRDGLRVYAHHTDIQSGPLSLVVVAGLHLLGDWTLPFAVGALCVVSLVALAKLRSPDDQRPAIFLIGGVVLVLWWPYFKMFGHLDDAMVLTLAVVAVTSATRGRRGWTVVLVGLALAVKPWSVFLLPITLTRADLGTRRMLRPLVSIGIAAIGWAPFILASSKTLDGLRPTVRLAPDSVLRLLGMDAVSPALRTTQLILAIVAVAVAVWRDRIGGAILAGVAVRIAVDPATWNYYTVGFVLGALVWDLTLSCRRLPWMTLAAGLVLLPTWVGGPDELRAVARLGMCIAAIAVVVRPTTDGGSATPASAAASTSTPSSAPSPTSDPVGVASTHTST